MKRGVLLCVAVLLTVSACGTSDSTENVATSTPRPAAIRVEDVPKAALSLQDMGPGWSTFDVAAVEGCTKIGGKICVQDVREQVSRKIEVGYQRGDNFVANTIVLMATEDDAREVVGAFRSAAGTKRWTQSFSTTDAIYELSTLRFRRHGDETLAFGIDLTATDRQSKRESSRQIDYILFRTGRVLSFLYVIEVGSAAIARKSAEKVGAL